MVSNLLAWAAAAPEYREALLNCAEEINAELAEEFGEVEPALLKHGYKSFSQMIRTSVKVWIEFYHSSTCKGALQSLMEEVEEIDRPKPETELGKVFHALKDGYQTFPEIQAHTRLYRHMVQRQLEGLMEIGLVRREEQKMLMSEKRG